MPVNENYCKDCGINAWCQWDEAQGCHVHEDFYVHDQLWDVTCPDDEVQEVRLEDGTVCRDGTFVLCIACFEKRLGREIAPVDFKSTSDPDESWYWRDLIGRKASPRFRSRLGI